MNSSRRVGERDGGPPLSCEDGASTRQFSPATAASLAPAADEGPRSNRLCPSGNMSAAELQRLYNAEHEAHGDAGTYPLRAILSCKGLHSGFHPETGLGSGTAAKIFQHYVLKQRIGAGSWGEVFIGVERLSGIQRAVKRIPKSTPHAVAMAREEVALMREMDHPNIVKVFDCFDDTGYFFVVMELCRGGELFDALVKRASFWGPKSHRYGAHANPPFTHQETALLMYQVLAATHCCHQQGICHRDIKPENFLFAEPDSLTLKLADFGLARRFRASRRDLILDRHDSLLNLVGAAAAAAVPPLPPSPAPPVSPAGAPGVVAEREASDGVFTRNENPSANRHQDEKHQQQQDEDGKILLRSVVGTVCFVAPEVLRLSSELIDKTHARNEQQRLVLQEQRELQEDQAEQQKAQQKEHEQHQEDEEEQQQKHQDEAFPRDPQHQVEGYDGERADAWSCGVLLYLLLCGELPFDGPDDADVAYSVLHGRPRFTHPVWKEVTAGTLELVVGLLEPDPAWRLLVGEALGSNFFSSVLPLHLPIPATATAAEEPAAAFVSGWCRSMRLSPVRWGSSFYAFIQTPDSGRDRCPSMPQLSTPASSVAAATRALTAAAAAGAAGPLGASLDEGANQGGFRETEGESPGHNSITVAVPSQILSASDDSGVSGHSAETPQTKGSGRAPVSSPRSRSLREKRLASLRRVAAAAAAVAAAPTAAEVVAFVSSLPFGRGRSAVPKWPWEETGSDAPDTKTVAAADDHAKREDDEDHRQLSVYHQQQQQEQQQMDVH